MTACAPGVRSPSSQKPRKDGWLVRAMDAVAEHKWGIGTELVSARWKGPRTIEDIRSPEIKLCAKGGHSWVTTVPNDARAVADAE